MGDKGDIDIPAHNLGDGLFNLRGMAVGRDLIGRKSLVAVGVMAGLGQTPAPPR